MSFLTRIPRKLLKLFAWVFGVIAVLLISFHFWFIHHAEEVLSQMVRTQSNGKIELKVKKFKFNWFSKNMELRDAVFYSTDSSTANASYRFDVLQMKMRIKSIFPIFLEKKILMDSLHLISPHISVTKLRNSRSAKSDTALSIPQEMGRIYHSIQDALKVLNVDRFQIDKGKFTLSDGRDASNTPLHISDFHFRLDNLKVDTSDADTEQKILFSDNVVVKSKHQDISFPDGRHKLSYKDFHIDVKNKFAEFDSCTVLATKGDDGNAFRVFFDKLRLTNIDFDTLYHKEIIKADSVYCFNPHFRLDVEVKSKTGNNNPPKLDELIQQLTGDIQLAVVMVENASFDINTTRDSIPNSFTSSHNTFQLEGLHINQHAERPFVVKKLAMAIRNYENFLKDSTYSIQFDSVHINDNRISLSNFTYKEFYPSGDSNQLNMPQFELYGLSWDNLIFNQELFAIKAVLYAPHIQYNARLKRKKNSETFFTTLAGIGRIVNLSEMEIRNGDITLYLENNARLQLEGTDLSIKASEFTDATKTDGLVKAVSLAHFKKGKFSNGTLSAQIEEASFDGDKQSFKAKSILLVDANTIHIAAKDIQLRHLSSAPSTQTFLLDGLQWKEASVTLTATSTGQHKKNGFVLTNLEGHNTKLTIATPDKQASTRITKLTAKEFSINAAKKIITQSVSASIEDLKFQSAATTLAIDKIDFKDETNTLLNGLLLIHQTELDTIHVTVPQAAIVPQLNNWLAKKFHFGKTSLSNPSIIAHLVQKQNSRPDSLSLQFESLSLDHPFIRFTQQQEEGNTFFEWNGAKNNNQIAAAGFHFKKNSSPKLTIDTLTFTAEDFTYTNAQNRQFNAGEGWLSADLQQVEWKKNDIGTAEWKGKLDRLDAKKFQLNNLGGKKGTALLEQGSITHLLISSGLLLKPTELIKQNPAFSLHHTTLSYQDSSTTYFTKNLSYHNQEHRLSLDSFYFSPRVERQRFMQQRQYQADHIVASTGKVTMGKFDITKLVNDTIIHIDSLHIYRGSLANYRDTRLPREPGIVRPLLIGMLKKIPVKLSVEKAFFDSLTVNYSELNSRTNQTGDISVNRLQATAGPLKNFGIKQNDSLEINATAYLQDSLFTRLYVHESYTDSLNGFLLKVEMGSADLRILNPILPPLASATIRSGQLDTLSMEAIGNEDFTVGEMKMIYKDFKIKLIQNPIKKRSKLFLGLANFVVNTLVKNQNTKRKGTVFFERWKDRSSINYLVKTTLSGITSSIGLQKSKKEARKFRKEIKKLEFSPAL